MRWRSLYRRMRSLERRACWLVRHAARIEESARGPGWRAEFAAADALSEDAGDALALAAEYRRELGL